jgi:hypothetical protein
MKKENNLFASFKSLKKGVGSGVESGSGFISQRCGSATLVSRVRFTFAGEEQTAEDAEDGPPELLFIHGGHTAKISGEAIFQKVVCKKKSKVIFYVRERLSK